MLTQAQTIRFLDQGYLVVEDVIDPTTLDAIRREYSERMDELYGQWQCQGLVEPAADGMTFWDKLTQCYGAGFDWYQPFDISLPHDGISDETPIHFGPAVFDLVTHRNILDIVESLIGPEITSNPIQHVRIKPPQRNLPGNEVRAHVTVTDWHQDRGVSLPEADQTEVVTVWVAVTDATPVNGCLQVIPGAGKEMYPHCLKEQVAIADGFVDVSKAVPAPVKAGGIILLHPLTPHSSLPNNSDGYRWSFDLRYNVTGQPTGRGHFPEFIARSRANPDTEMHDWQEWRARWEAARAHLARSPHIEQHRWPSDGPHCV